MAIQASIRGRRHRRLPEPTAALTKGLGRIRWFPRSEPAAPSEAGKPLPDLNPEETRRASRVARMASRLLSGLLANPSHKEPIEQAVKPLVKMANQIEEEARRAVVAPEEEEAVQPVRTPGPSPHATAWQAGYLDGESGLPPSFRGPEELAADYWDGLNVGRTEGQRRAAND